jgi:hypothetical protein
MLDPTVFGPASSIAVIRNIAGLNTVNAELEQDVRTECNSYGAGNQVVGSVRFVPGVMDASSADAVVQFQSVDAARACVAAMHNRTFDGRTLTSSFLDVGEFARMFSGPQQQL